MSDDEIEGEDEECKHEADEKPAAQEPLVILVLRELLPYTNAPQNRDSVSGSAQLDMNRTHSKICKTVCRLCDLLVQRVKDE